MDLHDLIRDRSLPRTRIRRLAKDEATRRLEEAYSEEALEEKEIKAEWPEIGLSVRVPPGSTRYQYEITDPEAFIKFVREEISFKHLLTEEEIFFFVQAGVLLRSVLETSEGWTLQDVDTGERAHPDRSWPGILTSQLTEPLDRLGFL